MVILKRESDLLEVDHKTDKKGLKTGLRKAS